MIQINNNSSSGGIGFLGVLTIVFIVLKLLGVITWSWVWVLAPLWIPAILLLIVLAALACYVLYDKIKN